MTSLEENYWKLEMIIIFCVMVMKRKEKEKEEEKEEERRKSGHLARRLKSQTHRGLRYGPIYKATHRLNLPQSSLPTCQGTLLLECKILRYLSSYAKS